MKFNVHIKNKELQKGAPSDYRLFSKLKDYLGQRKISNDNWCYVSLKRMEKMY